MTPVEVIASLQNALVKLDAVDERHAALKIAEAIDILEIEVGDKECLQKSRHYDND